MMPTLFIQPAKREKFLRLITAEIEHSLAVEPGILRFDLAADRSDPNAIHVYAVYADENAYAFHQAQPYYEQLMKDILPCFSKPPLIRMGTNLLPRDADWTRLARERRREAAARRRAARKPVPRTRKPARRTARKK
jgi:quinol monooxygenase YgiN